MSPLALSALLRGLVARLGGVEASAAVMRQRHGAFSKGTISKMMSGQAAVTVAAVVALEDAAGDWPVTGLMFGRIVTRAQAPECIRLLAADMSVEAGEAVASIVRAFSFASEDSTRMTEVERAAALAECAQARDVFARACAVLAAGERPAPKRARSMAAGKQDAPAAVPFHRRAGP